MNNVNILNAMIENGKICKVEFVKKDGTIGTVHGRTGVWRHAKGQRVTSTKRYITFYDFHKGYRSVNRNTIVSVNGLSLKIKHK
jgi:hypothetical protein